MPSEYEDWYASALEVMNVWLARGRALEIVTIRPDEFLDWLRARGLPNTAATRLKYVEEKARGGSSDLVGLAAASRASPASEGNPRA